jgi:co-chaperonin GroES (HSP10)
MRPIKDNLLIEPIEKELVVGGLVIIGKLDSTHRGKVLQVGADVKEVKVDETILYYDGQGLKFSEDRKDYVLIREGEISLVLD